MHPVPPSLSILYGRLKKSKVVLKGPNNGILHLESTWFLKATHCLTFQKEYSISKNMFPSSDEKKNGDAPPAFCLIERAILIKEHVNQLPLLMNL